MKRNLSLTTLGILLFAALTCPSIARAQIVPVNACAAAKAHCLSGQVKALLRCHQVAETKGLAVDAGCMAKAGDKFAACLAKAATKLPCLTSGDGPALTSQVDNYVQYVVSQLDPGYPAPIVNKCSAGKKKAVATTTGRRLDCLSKAFKKAPGTVDPTCLAKAETKLATTVARLDTNPSCLTNGDAGSLENIVDSFFAGVVDALNGIADLCGNGQNDAGEACDVSAPSSGWAGCGPGFLCSSCSCASPTRYELAIDDTDPASVLDLGWTGIGHRQAFSSDNTLTVGLTGCSGGTVRPSGTCSIAGPVANGFGKIANRRCSNDTPIRCTNDAPCTPGGGTCRYFLGSWHPRAAAGLAGCIAHEITGPVGGSVDVESGEIALTTTVTRHNYFGTAVDTPCPRCLNDPSNNDGVAGGTCSDGSHSGQACDGNATAAGYPDFGVTSLDCPPNPAVFVTDVTLALASVTQTVVRTVTAASPNCGDGSGEKCLCETCNNANAEPCSTNAECPHPPGPNGPLCGGRRCVGGPNNGTPCTTGSECPGANLCGRLGEPSKPSACLDDTATPGLDCIDTAPVDGEGECTNGPTGGSCSVASGHPQRACASDADCGGGLATCQARNRSCFLTGSAAGFGRAGTGTLIAEGAVDVPIQDVAHPILAAIGCVKPTSTNQLNIASGFPGPLRLTAKVTATALP